MSDKWGWYRVLWYSDFITQIAVAVIEYGKDDDQFAAFLPESFDAVAAFVGDDADVIARCVGEAVALMQSFSAIDRHTWSGSGHGTFHWREPMGCLLNREPSHWHRELAFASGKPQERWAHQREISS